MTATYSGDPAASSLDMVRYLIADTNMEIVTNSDEEILAMLGLYSNVFLCSAAIVEQNIHANSPGGIVRVGDLVVDYQTRGFFIQERAKQLRRLAYLHCMPYAGGTSVADRVLILADADRFMPKFWIGMMDNPPMTVSST